MSPSSEVVRMSRPIPCRMVLTAARRSTSSKGFFPRACAISLRASLRGVGTWKGILQITTWRRAFPGMSTPVQKESSPSSTVFPCVFMCSTISRRSRLPSWTRSGILWDLRIPPIFSATLSISIFEVSRTRVPPPPGSAEVSWMASSTFCGRDVFQRASSLPGSGRFLGMIILIFSSRLNGAGYSP